MPTSGCDCFLRKIWFLHAPQPWSSISLPTCVWWDMQDGGDAKDWGTQSVSDMRLYSPAIMLNLSSRNGQINISVFTPVVQSSQMHKRGREPIRKCDKQWHPSALCRKEWPRSEAAILTDALWEPKKVPECFTQLVRGDTAGLILQSQWQGGRGARKRWLGAWQSLFQVRSETTRRTSTNVTAAQPGPGITAGPQSCSVTLKPPSLPGLIQTPGFLQLLDSCTDLAWKKEWI